MIYIIGSGPSGISCAHALLKKGYNVTMLDVGMTLEKNITKDINILKKNNKQEWDTNIIRKIKGSISASIKGVPKKYLFGSNYPYYGSNEFLNVKDSNIEWRASLAKGGLSTVWGAAVLPYLDKDIRDWPININHLVPYYHKVFNFMDLSSSKDDLELIFPLYSDQNNTLKKSKQASILLNNLRKSKALLNQRGIFFGSSRLAVQSKKNKEKKECVYCGLCLYGCPYGLIFNSGKMIKSLYRLGNFTYLSNILVEKIIETKTGVVIKAKNGGKKVNFKGKKVFLASGVLSTTKILLNSMNEYDKSLKLKYSQYFLLPLFNYDIVKGVQKEELHTLSQAFIEIFDKSISLNTIHLQIYTYNDFYEKVLHKFSWFLNPFIKGIICNFLGRFMIVQGYLHSSISPIIKIHQKKNMNNPDIPSLHINWKKDKRFRKMKRKIKKIMFKLFKHKNLLRFFPLFPLLKIEPPLSGAHFGGSFPMKKKPEKFESDLWGRPFGYNNLHIVDATIFPSIPATTITLSIMANSYRIASTFEEANKQR